MSAWECQGACIFLFSLPSGCHCGVRTPLHGKCFWMKGKSTENPMSSLLREYISILVICVLHHIQCKLGRMEQVWGLSDTFSGRFLLSVCAAENSKGAGTPRRPRIILGFNGHREEANLFFKCLFVLFCFFETGSLYVAPPYRLGWPWTQRATCLCLLSAGLNGLCPHAHLRSLFG